MNSNSTLLKISLFLLLLKASTIAPTILSARGRALVAGYVRESKSLLGEGKSNLSLDFIVKIIYPYLKTIFKIGTPISCKFAIGITEKNFHFASLSPLDPTAIISYQKGQKKLKQWKIKGDKMTIIAELGVPFLGKSSVQVQDILFFAPHYLVILLNCSRFYFLKFSGKLPMIDHLKNQSWLFCHKSSQGWFPVDMDDDTQNVGSVHKQLKVVRWKKKMITFEHGESWHNMIGISRWNLATSPPSCKFQKFINLEDDWEFLKKDYVNAPFIFEIPTFTVEGQQESINLNHMLLKGEDGAHLLCYKRITSFSYTQYKKEECCRTMLQSFDFFIGGAYQGRALPIDRFVILKTRSNAWACAYDTLSGATYHQVFHFGPGIVLVRSFPISSDTFLLISYHDSYQNLNGKKLPFAEERSPGVYQILIMQWGLKYQQSIESFLEILEKNYSKSDQFIDKIKEWIKRENIVKLGSILEYHSNDITQYMSQVYDLKLEEEHSKALEKAKQEIKRLQLNCLAWRGVDTHTQFVSYTGYHLIGIDAGSSALQLIPIGY